ncbi:MAG: fatty acid desaturase [Candidatus Eremiobacterota bacterium]
MQPPEDALPRQDFVRVAYDEPHFLRMKSILKAHPEVRQLFGHCPRTALWAVGLVAAQLCMAAWLDGQPWWVLMLLGYLLGAPANHALWVITHECAHRLVFRSLLANRLLTLLANLPQVIPAGIAFCKYHLLHHAHQGDQDYDADLPSEREAAWAGNSVLRKTLTILFFTFVMGAIRPANMRKIPLVDGWTVLNLATQVTFLVWFVQVAGWGALAYLFFSFAFSIGLHPLAGRWIAEHYLMHGHQETYSYYGPLNKLTFNVGYHNEHHDFVQVPWNRLPELRAMASEFYEPLYSPPSWPGVLLRFLWSPQASFFDRVVRDPEGDSSTR